MEVTYDELIDKLHDVRISATQCAIAEPLLCSGFVDTDAAERFLDAGKAKYRRELGEVIDALVHAICMNDAFRFLIDQELKNWKTRCLRMNILRRRSKKSCFR